MKRWAVRRWRRLIFAAAAGAGIGCFLAWAANWFVFISGNLQGPDFFSFYAAAEIFVKQGPSSVYDILTQKQYEIAITNRPADTFIVLPYFHPPFYTLLIAPLAFLSYRAAYYAMTAFNVALLIALTVILVRGSLRVHGRAVIVAASLIAGFLPLFVTILQGQSDLVVLVPLAGAYMAWSRGRAGWAGVLSALAFSKPQLLLLIPVLFITRRSWRAMAGFAGAVLALALVSVAGFGFNPVLDYVSSVGSWAIGGQLPTHGQAVYTDTAVYSLRHILEILPGGGKVIAFAILVGLLALVAISLSWRPDKPRLDFALAVAASLVLSPHQNVHDLALLVIPGFALADLALDGSLRWPGIAALVLGVAYAAINLSLATALNLDVIRHARNLGYGGNQKTCYRRALQMGADVVVMLHPDGQYDPAIIPNLCRVIEDGEADIVLGSRWLGLDPAKAGMPWWKRLGNRFLTASENRVLGLHLSEYHTGYRAYSRQFLEAIPFLENSNDFVFDTQVLIQAATFGFRIGEVPAIGKYHEDASSVSFWTSTVYGLETLAALLRYVAHRAGFPCAWLTPASDAHKKALAVGQVAHHSQI